MAPGTAALRDRLRAVSHLERETAGLIGSNAINLVLGLAFWVAAARLYPSAVVGRATTMVSVAGSLASFTNLGLGSVIERFGSLAGTRRRPLVLAAYGISTATTVLAAVVFCVVKPVEDLFGTSTEAVAFVVLAVVLAVYALQDSDLISGAATRLVAVKNASVSATKLVVLLVAATAGTVLAIVGSWLVPAAIAVVAFGLLARRYRPEHERRMREREPTLPRWPAIGSFWGANLGWLVAGSIPSFVIPLVVIDEVGLSSAAYFNATWMIVSASAVLMTMAMSPYVAAAARPDSDLASLTKQFIRFMVIIGVLRGAGLAVGGSIALVLYGPAYAREAIPLLLVMALVHTLSIPAYIYGAFARVHRQVWYPMIVQAIGSAIVLAVTPMAVRDHGIVGVGWAYLVQEVVVVALATPPLIRLGRRSLAAGSPQGT